MRIMELVGYGYHSFPAIDGFLGVSHKPGPVIDHGNNVGNVIFVHSDIRFHHNIGTDSRLFAYKRTINKFLVKRSGYSV